MAGSQHLRRIERHRAKHQPAGHRTQEAPGNRGAKRPFDQRGRAHRADADRRRDEAEPDQRAVVDEVQGLRLGRADDVGRADDGLRGQSGHERGGEDGPDVGKRIGADDELESVEGSCQRRAERRCDRPAGPAADEHAQILPAQVEIHSHARGDAGADLRVARLKADRGAATVGHDRLPGDEEAFASDMRPPRSALASTGSTAGGSFLRARQASTEPSASPPSIGAAKAAIGGTRSAALRWTSKGMP